MQYVTCDASGHCAVSAPATPRCSGRIGTGHPNDHEITQEDEAPAEIIANHLAFVAHELAGRYADARGLRRAGFCNCRLCRPAFPRADTRHLRWRGRNRATPGSRNPPGGFAGAQQRLDPLAQRFIPGAGPGR